MQCGKDKSMRFFRKVAKYRVGSMCNACYRVYGKPKKEFNYREAIKKSLVRLGEEGHITDKEIKEYVEKYKEAAERILEKK